MGPRLALGSWEGERAGGALGAGGRDTGVAECVRALEGWGPGETRGWRAHLRVGL